MSAGAVRLLRILAVVVFLVGLAIVWIGDGPTEHAQIVYSCLLGGLALFALSFTAA